MVEYEKVEVAAPLPTGTNVIGSINVIQSGTWNIATLTGITNPVTVAQATPENLKNVAYGYDSGTPAYRPLKVDANGKAVVTV